MKMSYGTFGWLQWAFAATVVVLVEVMNHTLSADTSSGGSTSQGESRHQARFEITEVCPQEGWVRGTVDPHRWRVAPQPDLTAQLKAAPKLILQEVAPAPQRCWCGHMPYLVPNPDGQSWDMLFPYYNTYFGKQEVVIHDFGTGKTTRQILSTGRGSSVLTRERIDFHMQPSYYTRGKLFFVISGRPVIIIVYDPAEDRFSYGSKPFGAKVTHGRAVLGNDGAIYGMGWLSDKRAFLAYRIDPDTYRVERSEPFGPANPNRSELYCQVVMFGDWLYAGIGHRPWHLVCYNFKTKEGRLLATSQADLRGRGITLTKVKGGVAGRILEPVSVHGVQNFDRSEFRFWLQDGQVFPRTSNIPPWSDAPAEPDRTGTYRWAREFQRWRHFVPKTPPPEIKRDAGSPDVLGNVALPYRLPRQKEWQTLEYNVTMYPGIVRLLREVNDHVLFATDEGYGQHVFYDLQKRRIMRVGGTLSPYSIGLAENRLYVSGYPSMQMYEYDFSRPIGLKQPEPNPRFLGYLAEKTDTHCPLAGTFAAADGRIYTAGTTYERQRVGGGFGWYDPATGEIGGMPFEGHRIFWMTTADQGRYVLLSSKLEGRGALFCWDTQQQRFVYQAKEILGGGRPGPTAEVFSNGLIIGHHGKGLLYGLEAATGKVLWQKLVSQPPITSFSLVRRHAYCFRRGPDGFLWCFLGDVLVRINPKNGWVYPVGRMEPAQLAFVPGNIFVAGGRSLKRIANLSATIRRVLRRVSPSQG